MVYFLGIDVSTTGSKALIINESGTVVATASTPHTLSTPKPLWSEQHPQEWWDAAFASIRKVLAAAGILGEQVAAIGLTGQMHGLVLLDEAGNVLRPAILWNDQRTEAQCEEIHARIGRDRLISITGNVALTGFTAPKILWVRENEPDIYQRIRHILLPKDYVRLRLTGDYAMDKADGSGTILFDLKTRSWSSEVLDELGINAEWMPPTFEGPQFTGRVTPEAATVTGLKAGTPVAAGGGDQAAGAVGVGAVETGVIALALGTSGVVFATTPSALVESQGRLHAFCHAVPDRWHFMGVMLSAAGSLQWYRDMIAPGMSFDELVAEAELAPAGCEGLLFLPYLSGERTPHPDPLARGAFVGLTLRHTRAHLTRAVLEGVAFGLKDSLGLLQAANVGEAHQVRVSGGGAKSRLWRQILADVLQTELVTVNTTEGAAYGAALLAAVGAKAWPDITTACRITIQITGSAVPDVSKLRIYQHIYSIYRDLYPALTSSFSQMALQSELSVQIG